MEDKRELIKNTVRELLRIAAMYQRIEQMPIPVGNGDQVSTREAHMIQAVGEGRDLSVTQLADHFGITKSGASQMVKKLENKGYLLKRQSPHSNKEFELSLTDLGQKVFQVHEQLHGKDFNTLIDGLESFSISQIATLSVLMESIGTTMEKRLSSRDKKNT